MIIINEKRELNRRKIYEADNKTFDFIKREVDKELRNNVFKGARFKLNGKNDSSPFASFWCDIPLKSVSNKLTKDVSADEIANVLKAHLKKCGYDVYQVNVFPDNTVVSGKSDSRRGKSTVSGNIDLRLFYLPDYPDNLEVEVTLSYSQLTKNQVI